jgi:ribosomal protein L15
MKTQYYPQPKRGTKNPKSELFRYTVIRLKDQAERFTDRKPKVSLNFMTWDNRENCEVK